MNKINIQFYLISQKVKVILPKVIVFLSFFSLTSCFDIIDEVNLNTDGSGDMTLTVNLSKSKTKIASVMLLDSINNHKVPSKNDIELALEEAVNYLNDRNGISNVTKTADYKNYIFSINYHFNSVENINSAIKELLGKQKMQLFSNSYKYDLTKKIFSINYKYYSESKTQFNNLKNTDKDVFTDAVYTSIYRFNNEVTEYSNKNAKLSKSKKAMMLRTSALDLINGKINLTNQIHLKN